jgi:Fur family transcriptional regulator, ferric uptake regulator
MTPLEALCLQRGLRLTEHRRIVLEVLEASHDHPCVREIHRRAATGHRIGIATVYRTLNSLVERGMVRRQVFPDGRAHYERAGRPSHPHLIDVATGTIVEIDEADLEALLAEQARRLGYQLVDFSLKLFARPAAAGEAQDRN